MKLENWKQKELMKLINSFKYKYKMKINNGLIYKIKQIQKMLILLKKYLVNQFGHLYLKNIKHNIL